MARPWPPNSLVKGGRRSFPVGAVSAGSAVASPAGWFSDVGPVVGLGAALQAWLTADDHGTARMTDDGAGLISSWTSKDGSAVTVTAATTARPTWTANALSGGGGNSYAGLTFDGTANCLTSTTLTNIATGSTAGETWLSGTQAGLVADAAVRNAVAYGGTGAAQMRVLRRLVISSANRINATDASGNDTDTKVDLSGAFVAGAAFSGTTMSGRVNGRPFTPASATIGSLNTLTTRLRIGASNQTAATQFWSGVVRHCLIVTTLTTLQQLQLEAWLAWDIGRNDLLPDDHPFRFARP